MSSAREDIGKATFGTMPSGLLVQKYESIATSPGYASLVIVDEDVPLYRVTPSPVSNVRLGR
jgi:hypothetical protein